MRIKPRPDYTEASRRSIRRDFENRKEHRESEQPPAPSTTRRITFVGESSQYFKLRSYILGKLVRLIEPGQFGGWLCEFVHDDDRKKLNDAAGWSDNKKQYIFDCVKFK